MSGIGVITNPRSRRNRNNPRLAGRLAYVLGKRGDLQQPDGLDAIESAAQRFLENGVEVVCINGGDGTVHRALTAMVRVFGDRPLPRVAILRGGTMNIVANSVGVRASAADMLQQVVDDFHNDAPVAVTTRHLMRIGDQYGFLFGNGIIARFLELYYEGGEPTPAKAAWILGRGVLSTFVQGAYIRQLMKPWRGEVAIDGETIAGDSWTAVAVGTVEQMGLRFKPFNDVSKFPGHMQVVSVGGSVVDLARDLPRLWLGKSPARPGNGSAMGTVLQLSGDEELGYMIDGDFHRAGRELTIQIGPPVEFLLPRT